MTSRSAVRQAIRTEEYALERIAHRGAHDVFTENTLDAFQRAISVGFDAIELDVHATADGVCVVHHDETIVTTEVTLSIRGTYFDTLRAAVPLVPRLDDTLDLLAGRAKAYIEVKGRGYEHQVADVIAAARGAEGDGCAVHAFDHQVALRMKQLRPGLRTGILQTSRLVDSVHALRAARADDLWQWHEFIDAPLVSEVSAHGGRVIAWTANTPSEWRVFANIGVAAVCTDLVPAQSAAG